MTALCEVHEVCEWEVVLVKNMPIVAWVQAKKGTHFICRAVVQSHTPFLTVLHEGVEIEICRCVGGRTG
jgi:hypothetical protein